MEQPSVSKHLRVLRDVGLVRMRCQGRQKLYRDQRRSDTSSATSGPKPSSVIGSTSLNRTKERAEAMVPPGPTGVEFPKPESKGEIMISTGSRPLNNLTFTALTAKSVKAPWKDLCRAARALGRNETLEAISHLKIEAWPRRQVRTWGRQRAFLGVGQGPSKRPTLLGVLRPSSPPFPLVNKRAIPAERGQCGPPLIGLPGTPRARLLNDTQGDRDGPKAGLEHERAFAGTRRPADGKPALPIKN